MPINTVIGVTVHIWHVVAVPSFTHTLLAPLQATTFDLHCFQSPTGTKFLLVVEPASPHVPALLAR